MCTNICTHDRNEKGKIIMTLLDWEQRKLGDMANILRGASPRPIKDKKWFDTNSRIGWIRISDVTSQNGRVYTLGQHLSKKGQEKTRVVSSQTLLLSIAASVGYPVITYVETGVHDGFVIFDKPKFNLDFMFFKLQSIQNIWNKYGQAGSQVNINSSIVANTSISIPNIEEQKRISILLKKIEENIYLQQRKLEQLTLLKKAMLQQILTTNDYPKIRFRGFTNVWDQRRLEKIAKITTGKLDANAMVKNGKYDFYTSGIKKFKINTAAFEGPAITIAGNGATVGYMHLADGKFNAYQRTYVLNQFTVNRLFLFYSVKKVLPRSIYQSARTGNIPYIVLNMITDLKINIPKEKEQKKIGELFTEIQAILINQKNRLRCIKDLKQYLLQNIFL